MVSKDWVDQGHMLKLASADTTFCLIPRRFNSSVNTRVRSIREYKAYQLLVVLELVKVKMMSH